MARSFSSSEVDVDGSIFDRDSLVCKVNFALAEADLVKMIMYYTLINLIAGTIYWNKLYDHFASLVRYLCTFRPTRTPTLLKIFTPIIGISDTIRVKVFMTKHRFK